MFIGIPKEIKNHEYRVGATPEMVNALVNAGHRVHVEKSAGSSVGFPEEAYRAAGAVIVDDVWDAEMIIKVKEPQPEEYDKLKEGQILFCYLHLAPDPLQTKALLNKKVVAIAYETVTDPQGRLPLLTPMSEMAGRIATQVGAYHLQMAQGGRGVLLAGVPGTPPGKVLVIGGGVVGLSAARMALGLGADVTIVDINLNRLRYLDELFGPRLKTRYSTETAMEDLVHRSVLVIGAALIPGRAAPKVISEELVKKMKQRSVLVDVAIDQGGCAETSMPTSHSDPTFVKHDVIHYCVTNMPGACARTATRALTHATMSYALRIANHGWKEALRSDPCLQEGLNCCLGHCTYEGVAKDLGHDFTPPENFLN